MKKQILSVMMLLFTSVFFVACTHGQGAHTTEGMQALAEYRYEDAVTCFREAEDAGEEEIYFWRGLGIAHMGLLDYETAVTDFKTALSENGMVVDSLTVDINYYLAACYYKLGRYEDSIQIYDAILNYKKKDADAFFLRGNARLYLSDYALAAEDFDAAIAAAEHPVDMSVDVYLAYSDAGDEARGKAYLENGKALKKGLLTPIEEGRLYFYLGDYKTAVEKLEVLREKDDADAEALLLLGRAYEALGDWNYATMVYDKYVSNYPVKDARSAGIYNRLGMLYLESGDSVKALQAFSEAMQIPDNGIMQTLKFNEIVAYERGGDFATAEVLMNDYLKIYPDDEVAQKEYIFLSTR